MAPRTGGRGDYIHFADEADEEAACEKFTDTVAAYNQGISGSILD
jgi:hypothetical protein